MNSDYLWQESKSEWAHRDKKLCDLSGHSESRDEIRSFLDSTTMYLQGYMAKEEPFRRSSVCSSGTLFLKI